MFLCCTLFSQQISKTVWKEDLLILQKKLSTKDYLFNHISKNDFEVEIKKLQSDLSKNKQDNIWRLNELLCKFKIHNLYSNIENKTAFPFKIKSFKDGFYLTEIPKEYSYLLNCKLIEINGFTLNQLTQKLKKVFYLPHQNSIKKKFEKWINNKPLLRYLGILKEDLTLTFKTETNQKHRIQLKFITDFNEDELAHIKINKPFFSERKKDSWFWMYGINFGQQVFFKYQICSSNEHIKSWKDSLKITNRQYAKQYHLPIHKTYDAPKFYPFLTKMINRFDKKRYKKLIIDLRNNSKGSFQNSVKLIEKVAQLKRINKKKSLFILVNKNTDGAAIATILSFKNKTNAQIVGETVFGTKDDSNKQSFIDLPNSKFRVYFPLNIQKEVSIIPDISVEPTLTNYKNGIDELLQKVLDL